MQIGRQGDAGGLEDAADLAGDGGAGGDALAVLLDGGFLEAVEIAQQVGPFDDEAVAAGTDRPAPSAASGRGTSRTRGRGWRHPRNDRSGGS